MDYTNIQKVVNLTSHDVRVCVGKDIITIPPSGKIARLKMRSKPHGTVHGMPVSLQGEDGVLNNPDKIDGVIYITSSVVAKSLRRDDVLSPDTTDEGVLRDGDGNVFAVKRLQCFAVE
jgi:hypothetical protein